MHDGPSPKKEKNRDCHKVCDDRYTEGGQAKKIIFLAILNILDARGHNSTKAT